MLKKEIRLNFSDLRKRLSPDQIRDISQSISDLSKALPIWDFYCYHIFLPIDSKNEINTHLIIDFLRSKNKDILIPKVQSNKLLDHYKFDENTELGLSRWGIPEPKTGIPVSEKLIDVVFVPLLGFDLEGHRVGYGKGYYDRFLRACREDTIKVGLSHFEPVEVISDAGPEDIQLDYCVTPTRVYTF